MTKQVLDEGNEVVFYPAQMSKVTLDTPLKAVSHSMISAEEFERFAREAMEEYTKGLIKPMKSSADLL